MVYRRLHGGLPWDPQANAGERENESESLCVRVYAEVGERVSYLFNVRCLATNRLSFGGSEEIENSIYSNSLRLTCVHC